MDSKLVIRELQEIAAVPNGFDAKILQQMQENVAVDVMRLHTAEFGALIERQKAAGMPATDAERERRGFFARLLQTEYRNRVHNGNGFSLPFYVETAENFYRLEIGRHMQAVKDYITLGKTIAESFQLHDTYEIRNTGADMKDLAHRVADGLNGLNEALDKLGRVKIQAAKAASESLRQEMTQMLGELRNDSLSQSLLAEASTLATAKRYLAEMEPEEPELSVARP